MGRGVSSGGGQSSLGYLFGGGEAPAPRPTRNNSEAVKSGPVVNKDAPSKPAADPIPTTSAVIIGNIPAGVPGNTGNNYFRADGQNCGNFITDRPSTKVHAAPGGGSSLGYLFGGPSNN